MVKLTFARLKEIEEFVRRKAILKGTVRKGSGFSREELLTFVALKDYCAKLFWAPDHAASIEVIAEEVGIPVDQLRPWVEQNVQLLRDSRT